MSEVIVLSKPWWRWFRQWFQRRRRSGGAVVKPWNGLVIPLIALLVALDAVTKNVLVTQGNPDGHTTSTAWIVSAALSGLILLPFLRYPATRYAAALLIGGCIGNLIPAVLHGSVNNPILVQTETHSLAFNLADTYLVVGISLLIATVLLLPRRRSA